MKFVIFLSCLIITQCVNICCGGLGGKNLEEYYPWLRDHLNGDRQISISTEGDAISKFDLGESLLREELPIVPCNNPVFGVRGRCELLRECVLGPSRITNFEKYLKHFCSFQDKFAGVCC